MPSFDKDINTTIKQTYIKKKMNKCHQINVFLLHFKSLKYKEYLIKIKRE